MILLVAAAALAGGCGSNNIGETPNPQPLPNKSFAREWSAELRGGGDDPVTAVHVTDQFVFAYRQGGTSTVIDRASGRLLHIDEPKDGAQRMHPPVILKDRIVYPTTTYLEVFDLSGRYVPHATKPSDEMDKPFSQALKFPIRSDVVGMGKLVFFGADFEGGGRVVAVDLMRPYVPDIWTLLTPGASVSAAPALSKDTVFVAAENGTVAAVTIDSRAPLWTLPNGVFGTYGGVTGNLALDASGLYVASNDTKLYCLLPTSGKVKWQYFAGAALRDGPVLTKDLVYQMVPNAGLAAIDKSEAISSQSPTYNRQPRWIAIDATQFLSEDDRYAYVRTGDNHIVAVDKKTGQRAFTSQRNDLAACGVNTKGDGIIYAATTNGRVMAVKPVLQPGLVGELVMVPMPREAIATVR